MHGLYHVAAMTLVISALIPLGSSIGLFIGICILSVLKRDEDGEDS